MINLAPKILMGWESEGMLLAAENDTGLIILIPDSETKNGAIIR